ncbi:MAG TPA: flagellar basal body-associated FliL family protein [Roseococcus sp.]|nr:flagellar basal body-associated FliL family protein [Roseococcus sp.]
MAAPQAADPPQEGVPAGSSKKKKLILIAVPLLLAASGGGAFFMGLIPGMGSPPPPATASGASPAPVNRQPVFVALPEITANLNAPGRRAAFIRLKSQIEVMGPQDAAALQAAMPRIVDLFTTYLREMRPEELRGSAGTHRLREELTARANIAAAPARVTDVLFTEILVQ